MFPVLQSGNQNPQSNIMMQAFGAMMRGESPQQFLQILRRMILDSKDLIYLIRKKQRNSYISKTDRI